MIIADLKVIEKAVVRPVDDAQVAPRIGLEQYYSEAIACGAFGGTYPWVALKFLLTDVVPGKRKMTRARWNNVLAPMLLPLVSAPLGPMTYCMITAAKR
jgi:hypothetical protein